jgi:uncharacterized RDD family membrane protein YckC
METENTLEPVGLFEDFVQHKDAAVGQRFLNWLIDNLLMRFGLSYVTGMGVGVLIVNFFPDFASRIVNEGETIDLFILGYAIGIFNYLIYYTICEKAFRGYTLGKVITGTRAIRDDGEELKLGDAFKRSLIRLIPFEVLSGFGNRPWHDSWTRTKVIQVR